MESLSLSLTSLEDKRSDQMITLVEASHLDNEEVDNSIPLVHHVLDTDHPNNFSSEVITTKSGQNNHCLVCNGKLSVSGRGAMHIFSDDVKTTSRRLDLVCVLSKVVERELDASSTHSTVICKKCFKLLDDIDSLEEQLANLKEEVSNKFNHTESLALEGENDQTTSFTQHIVTQESVSQEDTREYRITSKVKGKKGRKKRGRGRPANFVKLEVKDESSKDGINWLGLSNVQGLEVTLDDDESEMDDVRSLLVSEQTGEEVKIDVQEDVFEVDGLDINNEENTLQVGGMILPTVSIEVTRKELMAKEANPDARYDDSRGKYRCRLCQVRFWFFSDVQDHLIQNHADRIFECEICGECLNSQLDLISHLDNHMYNEGKRYLCRLCPKRYALPRQLKVHLRHHATKTISCYRCPKRFRSEVALQEHMNAHTGYRPFVCEQCHKCFTSKHILKTHLRTHKVRTRDHKCTVCFKEFLTHHHLNDHMQIHQGRKEYICEHCGKAFNTQRSLEIHFVTHSGVKNFSCRICFKAFARKGEVEDHERIHTGEKPFQCEICGATFCQRSNLQSHKRATHFDERKYQCTECPKAFKRKRLLVYHVMSVHTGERPYKCEFCSASFVYPEHYKKHMRIHTGEKPFKCEICGKAFNSRDNKNAHKFIHSDKKQYECSLCSMSFMRKPQVLVHIDQYHPCETPEDYVKVNPATVVDEELSGSKLLSGATLTMKINEESPMEQNIEDHMQLIRTTEEDTDAVEVLPRSIQIVDSDDISRYIIQKPVDAKSDENMSHFLASLNGQVVEVRTDGIERYAELTPEQLTQMTQVVPSNSTATSTTSLTHDPSEFRLFQIQLEDDKDQSHPTSILPHTT